MGRLFLLFFFLFGSVVGFSQSAIRGTITDGQDGKPIANVVILNIHTSGGSTSDSNGNFLLTAAKSQLLEFRKLGYKTTRLRIPAGALPPFFRIVMEKGAFELDEVTVRRQFEDYKRDSLRYAETFEAPLRVGRLSTSGVLKDPFLALSKSRRKVWDFQKEYEQNEKLRYVDYTFSERAIQAVSGLKGDSLIRFRNAYRPSYEQVRDWSEYELFRYIKASAAHFRTHR